MPIVRAIFKNAFPSDSLPPWICPTCSTGVLHEYEKSIMTLESSLSLNAHSHPDWDPDWIRGIFCGVLRCNNRKCRERVVFGGTMEVDEDMVYLQDSDGYEPVTFERLKPKYFNPPLDIFKVHHEIPESIKIEIKNSFNIFWLDVASCANKVRVVVEQIMDDKGVVKKYNSGGKRREHSLHQRILKFKVTNPEEADLLMAIKWIGNTGSHTNEALTVDDVLDAYEILEYVTTKLYDTQAEKIKKLSKAINKRKKPISNAPKPKKKK